MSICHRRCVVVMLRQITETNEETGAETADDVATVTGCDEMIAEHLACWRLEQRGGVGETALHLCMLYAKLPQFRVICLALLGIFPQLSVDYYEGDEYYGK